MGPRNAGLAGGMFFGGLYAFLNSAEQIFAVRFALGGAFPLAFSAIAGVMASPGDFDAADGEFLVTGTDPTNGLTGLSPASMAPVGR